MSRALLPSVLAAALLTGFISPAAAQSPASPPLATQLASVMSSAGANAIAVRDPSAPDRAIAALVFPGSQLLVVSARYPDANLEAALSAHRYSDVYSALQQPTVNTGKIFIQDLGCDGLQSGASSVDILYLDGKTQTIFDGNWKSQKMSQAPYERRLKDADTRYAAILSALIAAVQADAHR